MKPKDWSFLATKLEITQAVHIVTLLAIFYLQIMHYENNGIDSVGLENEDLLKFSGLGFRRSN